MSINKKYLILSVFVAFVLSCIDVPNPYKSTSLTDISLEESSFNSGDTVYINETVELAVSLFLKKNIAEININIEQGTFLDTTINVAKISNETNPLRYKISFSTTGRKEIVVLAQFAPNIKNNVSKRCTLFVTEVTNNPKLERLLPHSDTVNTIDSMLNISGLVTNLSQDYYFVYCKLNGSILEDIDTVNYLNSRWDFDVFLSHGINNVALLLHEHADPFSKIVNCINMQITYNDTNNSE